MSIVAFPNLSRDPDQASSAQSPLGLADYLQMASYGRRTIRLLVMTAAGHVGVLDTDDGLMVHATLGSLRGAEAVAHMLAADIRDVEVVDQPASVPESDEGLPKSIDRLLLDLAFETDRASRREDGEQPASRGRPEEDPGAFARLFHQAMAAYLERDLESAVRLFEVCQALRPDDQRVAGNLRRLGQIRSSRTHD